MRRWLSVLGAIALIVAVPVSASPQEDPAEPLPLQLEVLDARDHPQVEAIVSLPSALPAGDVDPAAFRITEDGEPIDAVVEAVPTEGLDVVLLMDTSGSMRGAALASAKAAAVAFVEKMPDEVGVAVVAFGEGAEVASPFSADRGATVQAIGTLGAAGETALYDGLVAGTELFSSEAGNRRVVVMLSDGGDTVSAGSLEQSIVALLTAEARFYAVELQTAENDHEPLARLGAATDGRVVAADDVAALDGIFEEIAAAIVSQYHIAFETPGFGPTNLEVTVSTADGLTAALSRVVRYPPPPPPPVVEPTPTVPEPVVVPAESEPVAIPAPLLPTTTIVLGWLASREALLLGMAALFISFFALSWHLGRGGRRVTLAAADAKAILRTRDKSLLTRATDQVAGFAERTLERRGRKNQLERVLEAAGLTLRVGEFVVLMLAGGLGAFAVGYLLATVEVGLALGALAVAIGWLSVAQKAAKRTAAFAEQLFPTLQLISGSLRAGFGLGQAFDVVAEESPPPTSDEFRRVKVETHLGRDLDTALVEMAERVSSEDFELFIEAVQIHREIGGELSQIIENIAETIRERNHLKGQIQALSAEGRFSGGILVALPLIMGAWLSITNPTYVGELTGMTGGRIVLAVGGVLLVVGIVWIKRLIRLDY